MPAQMNSESTAQPFDEPDVLGNRGFAAVYRLIGFYTWRQRITLAAAIIVPLLLFWYATVREHRFFLGSLVSDATVDQKTWKVVGVSFAGDPMVWGYTILVPFLIAVLGVAVQRTLNLVNTATAKASPPWRADASENGFNPAVEETCRIWRMEPAGRRRVRVVLLVLPWILAGSMWIYNTLTCGSHELGFPLNYPYTSARVTLISPGGDAAAKKNSEPMSSAPETAAFDGKQVSLAAAEKRTTATRDLDRPIPLRKWDCEPRIAPLSFWLARIWTLFYYCVLPFLIREIVVLVWGATYFLGAGQRWEKPGLDDEPSLDINPFESDGFGGLGALADAATIYCYCVSIPAALLGLSFFKEGVPPEWHDYLLMGLYVPVGIWLALTPVLTVHNAIVSCKNRLLSVIAGKMNALGHQLLHGHQESEDRPDAKSIEDQRQAYSRLFADVKQMKEWPFDLLSLARIALSIAAPWLPALIKEMGSSLLGLAGHSG